MKTNYKKTICAAGFATVAALVLAACATTTLEQQIAVKEPGSWDFKVDLKTGGTEYVRIYDSPGKLGFFKFEYGQKHPCNQGFQKVIKTTAPGLVRYAHDPDAKSFACTIRTSYVFRTDAQGNPYEGWVSEIKDSEKREFPKVAYTVKHWDDKGEKPNYLLVK